MESPLQEYAADHRYLMSAVARQVGFADPVALDLDEFSTPLLKAARKGELMPVDGVLIRDWDPDLRQVDSGIRLGLRVYTVEDVRFVRVCFSHHDSVNSAGLDFFAVDRPHYRRLYRIALRCRRDLNKPSQPPVLPSEQAELLWQNTIGYLDGANLRRIKSWGGRARRGLLLTGAPGNGKTMACRWIWEECRQRRWDWRLVTPDSYRQARQDGTIDALFSFGRRGIVFFDDMDLALRDRNRFGETEDQSVFLGALDGITVTEGVVFVFTSNCPLTDIDPAFKRPGRLDLVLQFEAPDPSLRRRLIERWHADVRARLDLDDAIASTTGFSFAEIEELKNLLIMHYTDTGEWEWPWALEQFDINRKELTSPPARRVGFGAVEPVFGSATRGL